MTILIRSFEAQHFGSMLDVYNQAAPPGIHPPLNDVAASQIYVAVEDHTEAVVGFAIVPRKECYSFDLVVSPRWQRQGIGGQLWSQIEHDLLKIGATAVEPWVREENAIGISWLRKHGFTPTRLDGPVSLFLKEADTQHYDTAVNHIVRQGFEITTISDERARDPECLGKLCKLYNIVNADAPRSEELREQNLEEFTREQDEPDAMPNAYFIARKGSNYVGLSYQRPRGPDPNCIEPGNVQQCLTGVLPEFRRRGIATALKCHVIAYARDHGFTRLLTNSDNPAMQALNAKLGFTSGPWRVYHKKLQPG